MLLSPRELRLLHGMRLQPRKSFAGRVQGERLTVAKGVSTEFSDYREYTDGDDLRHLDWNVLARLDNPVIKTYRDEQELNVTLLIDSSASMSFGSPTKFDASLKFGAALGLVALASGDAVVLKSLGDRSRTRPPLRGAPGASSLIRQAEALKAEGGRSLVAALDDFTKSRHPKGLVILLSDGLDQRLSPALRRLAGRGHEIWFVQVLSRSERDPDVEGDLRLIDAEDGSAVDVTANTATVNEYLQRLDQHVASLQNLVLQVGGRFCLVTSDDSLEQVAKNIFRRDGWVK